MNGTNVKIVLEIVKCRPQICHYLSYRNTLQFLLFLEKYYIKIVLKFMCPYFL